MNPKNLKNDNVNHPNHYTRTTLETIHFLEAVAERYPNWAVVSISNALKYISRAPYKNRDEDLNKAKWYLKNLIRQPRNQKHSPQGQTYLVNIDLYVQEVSALYKEEGYQKEIFMVLMQIAYSKHPIAEIAWNTLCILEDITLDKIEE